MDRQNLKKWLNYSIPAIALIGTLFISMANEDSKKEEKNESVSSYNMSQLESITKVVDITKGDSVSEKITKSQDGETQVSQFAQATQKDTTVGLENATSVRVFETGNQIIDESVPLASSSESQNTQSGSEVETPKTLVATYPVQSVLSMTHIKYGVNLVVYQVKVIQEYSDGSKVETGSYEQSELDTSGYSASDQDLKADAAGEAAAHADYANRILELVNEIRAEAGVDPLVLDVNLTKAATMRAIELDYSDTFAHERPDGRHWNTVFAACGLDYTSAGENIAAGQKTPEQVVEAWKNSEGHYRNMVNAKYTKLGVGYSNSNVGTYKVYWSQLFMN